MCPGGLSIHPSGNHAMLGFNAPAGPARLQLPLCFADAMACSSALRLSVSSSFSERSRAIRSCCNLNSSSSILFSATETRSLERMEMEVAPVLPVRTARVDGAVHLPMGSECARQRWAQSCPQHGGNQLLAEDASESAHLNARRRWRRHICLSDIAWWCGLKARASCVLRSVRLSARLSAQLSPLLNGDHLHRSDGCTR